MAKSIVYVQYKSGNPAKSVKVTLGMHAGGMTKPVYTDKDGRAVLDHSSTGKATVFVNGKDKGTMSTPGDIYIFI
jgi:5-hydroxyisourate hydrolase-like protein (transthyretin family)